MQKNRPPKPALAEFPWVIPMELRFADTDKLGHVNNGAFGSLMESSRSMLLMREGLRPGADAYFVLARFEIDYFDELHWPGTIETALRIARIGTSSIVMTQALFRDGACAALAQSTIVLVDRAGRCATPVTDAMRAVLKEFAGGA